MWPRKLRIRHGKEIAMGFDFDALPDDAKRAFFAKVKPGKSNRTESSGDDEDSNQEPTGDSEARQDS
jgi:hypothetical protein